jgi:hypothetical protein
MLTYALSGQFVRIAPNEVSTTHPEVIKKLILTPQLKVFSIMQPSFKVEY